MLVTHRRFGKSIFGTNQMISEAALNKQSMPRYAYIAPTYAMSKRIIWDPLKHYSSFLPGTTYNEADLRVDIQTNQARMMLLSGENYESLKGIYLDGSVLDEYAQMSPSVWTEAIRPTLVDRNGWAIFMGTPKGQNHFQELYEYARDSGDPEWFCAVFKASETGIIPATELASLRKTMTEEEYMQEFECDFTSGLSHAYFTKDLKLAEQEGRIRELPYDPSIPVDTYWDLGVNDATAIIFVQSTRFEHRIIDYYETSGEGLNKVVPEIMKKPYQFGEFVLPHDVMVRDLSTGKSRLQNLRDMGLRQTRVVPRVGKKEESINAARMIFSQCYFEKRKCAELLKRLMNYQKRWDDKRSVYLATPLHNFASNAADAFQCFAMGQRDRTGNIESGASRYDRGSSEDFFSETEYDVFARGDL